MREMRAGAGIALVCSTLACGRISFDPLAGGSADAPTSDIDAPVLPTGPFGSPTPLTTVNSGTTDVDPSMTDDRLLLFFASLRTGNMNIYSSSRAAVGDPWPDPTVVGAGTISTSQTEQDPVISSDGLTLYFTRAGDIYMATRLTRADIFNPPVAITELNTSDLDVVASVTSDGLALTMHSTRPGSQMNDIYLATRPALGATWSVPQPMPGAVNSGSTESDSYLWADRLTLYFDSDRTGDFDIYVTTRATVADPFGIPVLSELSTSQQEADSWLSADGHTILFVRGPSLVGNLDIYEATR